MLSTPGGSRLLQRWIPFRLPGQAPAKPSTSTCTIEGGSRFGKKKAFPIRSLHWGVTQSRRARESSQSEVSGTTDFSVVKDVDAVSPDLFQAAALGDKIEKVEIALTRGSTRIVYEFRDVYVTSVRPGGGSGQGATLVEEVSFSFGSVSYNPEQPAQQAVWPERWTPG